MEIIGILAGIVVLLSFIPKELKYIRIINIMGCILFVIYGCRLGGYLLIREIKSASYRNTMKKEIKVWDYAGRIMEAIDEGILLTTAAQGEKDTMVIGWGHIGVIWGKPVFVAYVRESRHTKSLVDKNGELP